jgi:hypothetical protein
MTRRLPDPEHQIRNLVLRTQRARGATCRQTPCLATKARNCDHIATMPPVTGGDGCPSRTSDGAVDQEQRGSEGTRRTGGDGCWLTTDLAVGGSNPSRRATKPAGQRPVIARRADGRSGDCDPIATPLAGTPDTAATPCDPIAHTDAAAPRWRRRRQRLAGRPHQRRRSHVNLRAGGAYPCPPSSDCQPWLLPLVGPVGRTPAADWPPSGEWSGRAARSASRD